MILVSRFDGCMLTGMKTDWTTTDHAPLDGGCLKKFIDEGRRVKPRGTIYLLMCRPSSARPTGLRDRHKSRRVCHEPFKMRPSGYMLQALSAVLCCWLHLAFRSCGSTATASPLLLLLSMTSRGGSDTMTANNMLSLAGKVSAVLCCPS